MNVSIYLDFGLLDDQAQIDVTLVWDDGQVASREDGKLLESEYPAGYIIDDVTWVSDYGAFNMNRKMVEDSQFCEAVRDALIDEGYEV